MSSKELTEDDIALSRGKEDFLFIHTQLPDLKQDEDAEAELKNEMSQRGLEWENCQVIGIFRDEFSLRLSKESEVKLNGKKIYPEE